MRSVVVAGAVVVGAALSGAAPASAGTPAWRVEYVPKPPQTSTFLSGVSCPLHADCTAVGFATNSAGNPAALAEHWDGMRWAIQPTPSPAGALQTSLSSVSCTSATSCTAVGTYFPKPSPGVGYQPLAEHWDGAQWTIQPTPVPAGAPQAQLGAVSCASATSCTAVGFYYAGARGPFPPLAEHWDGTQWTVQQVPLPGGASDGMLNGVSCPTSLSCTAVGQTGGNTNVLAERWNGARWTAQTVPRPPGANVALASVSCRARELCVAVGSAGGGGAATTPVVERADGPTWTIQADAAPAGTNLYGVSCPFSQSCTAVGVNTPAGTPPVPTTPVAEHWDGTSWALQTVPVPSGTFGAELGGVSCLSTRYCTAVGDYGKGGRFAFPLAEHYR